jgi:hypothetical protein
MYKVSGFNISIPNYMQNFKPSVIVFSVELLKFIQFVKHFSVEP